MDNFFKRLVGSILFIFPKNTNTAYRYLYREVYLLSINIDITKVDIYKLIKCIFNDSYICNLFRNLMF